MACNNAVSATDGGQLELECGHQMHRQCIKKDMYTKLRKKMLCFYCKRPSKIGQAIYDEEFRRDDELRQKVTAKEEKIEEDEIIRHMASEMHKTGELIMSNRQRQAQIQAFRRFEKKKAPGNDGNDGNKKISASQKRRERKKKLKEMKKHGQSKGSKKKEDAKKSRKGRKDKKKSKYIFRNEDELMDTLQSMGLAGLRNEDAISAPSYVDELGRKPKCAITEEGIIYNGRRIPWGEWNSSSIIK